jgi:DNA-binding MarR family transcriptional regulator
LTGSEINALANLAGGDGSTVSDLAAAAGIRPTTMTSVLDRLGQRGLIRRAIKPGDRRAVVVKLTASGRRTARVIQETISGLERGAFAGLDAAAIDGLRAGLEALAEATS